MSEFSFDEAFMREALVEADLAAAKGEVPIGCVLVAKGEAGADSSMPGGPVVIARGHNLRETTRDPTAHAEVVALRNAAAARANWRMDDVTAYVTLEPCPMCAGAFVNARIVRVVYGCDDAKAGAVRTRYGIGVDGVLNHTFALEHGLLADECRERLQRFFAVLRAQGKK